MLPASPYLCLQVQPCSLSRRSASGHPRSRASSRRKWSRGAGCLTCEITVTLKCCARCARFFFVSPSLPLSACQSFTHARTHRLTHHPFTTHSPTPALTHSLTLSLSFSLSLSLSPSLSLALCLSLCPVPSRPVPSCLFACVCYRYCVFLSDLHLSVFSPQISFRLSVGVSVCLCVCRCVHACRGCHCSYVWSEHGVAEAWRVFTFSFRSRSPPKVGLGSIITRKKEERRYVRSAGA